MKQPTYECLKIIHDSSELDCIFADIKNIWISRGENNDIVGFIKQKAFHNKKNKITKYIFKINGLIQGLAYFEHTSPYYGNVTIHVTDDTYLSFFVDDLIKTGNFDQSIIEIVNFDLKSIYKDIFYRKQNMIANIFLRKITNRSNLNHYLLTMLNGRDL